MRYVSHKNSFKFLFSENSWSKLAAFGSNFENQKILLFTGVFRGNKRRLLSPNGITLAKNIKR